MCTQAPTLADLCQRCALSGCGGAGGQPAGGSRPRRQRRLGSSRQQRGGFGAIASAPPRPPPDAHARRRRRGGGGGGPRAAEDGASAGGPGTAGAAPQPPAGTLPATPFSDGEAQKHCKIPLADLPAAVPCRAPQQVVLSGTSPRACRRSRVLARITSLHVILDAL